MLKSERKTFIQMRPYGWLPLLLCGVVLLHLNTGCVASKDFEHKRIRKLQKNRIEDDTSFTYALPFETGKTHLVVQGYYSPFSHKNRIAVDFKMKKGTTITAARDGVVVRAVGTNTSGGLNKKFLQKGNNVVIEHIDGTRAGYWHLAPDGVLVKIGDTVKTGQPIAISGKTGYSAFPHLHFISWKNKNGQWQQLPTRFQTKKGPKYLRPFRWYKKQ